MNTVDADSQIKAAGENKELYSNTAEWCDIYNNILWTTLLLLRDLNFRLIV